jgi:4-hydroxy-tetrahydrodipicolinate reductase
VVDYTLPAATVANCEYYCEKGLPFVMGTTVKDRSLLASIVEKSQISAVIAPNMSKPIVAVVAMFDYVAENFAGALDGFELQIVESHQRAKQGKSGTADAIGKNLKLLGASYAGEEDILPIRNPKQQRFMGVPEDALGGHGWHSYELMSPDGSVFLKFEHNVNGRSTYIDGTEVAINFLAKKMAAGSLGKCFSMTDVMMG